MEGIGLPAGVAVLYIRLDAFVENALRRQGVSIGKPFQQAGDDSLFSVGLLPRFSGKLEGHGPLSFKGRLPAQAQGGAEAIKEAAGAGRHDRVDTVVSQEKLGLQFFLAAETELFSQSAVCSLFRPVLSYSRLTAMRQPSRDAASPPT